MAEKGGISQAHQTSGGISHPVEGLSNDAGLGKPPAPDAYGPVGTGSLPCGGKTPGGNSKAINAWFGSQSPGGGKK